MTDYATLIAELRQHAEWARAELRQSQAELFDRAADELERTTRQMVSIDFASVQPLLPEQIAEQREWIKKHYR